MLADLPKTFKAEGVATRKGVGLLFVVVISLEAYPTFEY